MLAEGRIDRVVIIDCDVHQGNGTAAIFSADPFVYTFSIHAEKNFPFHKSASHLDIGLEDGCGDAGYLAALRGGLETAIEESQPAGPHIAAPIPSATTAGPLALTKPGCSNATACA